MKWISSLGAAAVLSLVAASHAGATVVTFDELPGASGVVPDGCAGITWNGQWNYFAGPIGPYAPESPPNWTYDLFGTPGQFNFSSPVVFNGAYFSGYSFSGVHFDLFLSGVQVATSGSLTPNSTPTFLSSGYSGLVDEVRVTGQTDFFAMDNVTFNAVPEPATWAMLILGLGMIGFAARRRTAGAALAA